MCFQDVPGHVVLAGIRMAKHRVGVQMSNSVFGVVRYFKLAILLISRRHHMLSSAIEKPCACARLGWLRLWAATRAVNCAGSTPKNAHSGTSEWACSKKACGEMSTCLVWACELVRTPFWPKRYVHQSRFARFPKQLEVAFLERVFTFGFCPFALPAFLRSLLEMLGAATVEKWRGTRSLHTGYGAFVLATPKEGYGVFFSYWFGWRRGPKKAGYGPNLGLNFLGFSAPQFPNFDICNCLLEGLHLALMFPLRWFPWVEI